MICDADGTDSFSSQWEVVMKSLCFVICSAFLFSTFAASQADSPDQRVKASEPSYERATLLRMTARAHTQTREIYRGSLLDSPIISETIVTYDFVVHLGTQRYTSRHTPERQPGNMPNAWWQGNSPVEVRIVGHNMFIRPPHGIELKSRIVSQAADN